MTPTTTTTELPALLRDHDIAKIIGCSRRHVWTLVSAGRIPRPVKISTRCARWRREVIADTLAQLANR
jgi:prophage regulatory protein